MNLWDEACDAFSRDDFGTAECLYLRLLEQGDGAEREAAEWNLGFVYAQTRRTDEARILYRRALERAVSSADVQSEHRALHQLGMVERLAGHWDAALSLFDQEAEIFPRLEDAALARSANAYEQGLVRVLAGRLDAADLWFGVALEQGEQSGDLTAVACAWRGRGELEAARGNAAGMAAHLERARATFEQAGDAVGVQEIDLLLERGVPGAP